MTRREENKMLIEVLDKKVKRMPTGTYNELVTLHLGAIASMLADISRSLAILADMAESEGKNDNN